MLASLIFYIAFKVFRTCVANVVGLQLAVCQVPDLDVLIPTSRHDNWVQVVWREPKFNFLKLLKIKEKIPHARNPVLVPLFSWMAHSTLKYERHMFDLLS